MDYLREQLKEFKRIYELAILEGGTKGVTSAIRSSSMIELIHGAVKQQLIDEGVDPNLIYPRLNATRPEIELAGFLKKKKQDICVIPKNIPSAPGPITWGPMTFSGETDNYGEEYTRNTLVINVRSQMSSIAKNSDTLFERTFAEALNLHLRCPNIVLGEVYMIPVCEYNDELMKSNHVGFSSRITNVEKYISFFSAINSRIDTSKDDYAYERCALLLVDFREDDPILFLTTQQLKEAGIIRNDFQIEYEPLSFQGFSRDILEVYNSRFDIHNLKL